MKQKLGQMFFIGIEGPELSANEAQFIVENNIGGVTLFGRNLQSPEQIYKLNSDLQNLRHKMPNKTPLFIGIDMEGGRVHRLKSPFTQWPAVKRLGDLDSTSLAFKMAQAMGTELKAVGFNLNFAPSADVLTNPKNEIIGDRAVSTDPEMVGKVASALVRGYIKSEIIPCAKHFPGHGNTLLDSHEELPVEETPYDVLSDRELNPFKKVFRARLDLVMTAHIKFTAVDPEWPATLSKKFLTDIIRDEFRYKNAVISDDLDMKALRNHYKIDEIALKAIDAGCDLLLYCNEPDSPKIALEACHKALGDGSLSAARIEESISRIVKIKEKWLKEPDPLPWNEAKLLIGHPEHLKLAQAIESGDVPEEMKSTT
ncbi:MAG: beta-N-acetylhexosaminidase [Bdellovibrionales bacterium]|nr:beta-N-acetylhexosaminidase [Bdellovibrionales bacterium]